MVCNTINEREEEGGYNGCTDKEGKYTVINCMITILSETGAIIVERKFVRRRKD